MGYRLDGTEADFRALARMGIVYAFRPEDGSGAYEQEETRANDI
jgi:hypothetical protein